MSAAERYLAERAQLSRQRLGASASALAQLGGVQQVEGLVRSHPYLTTASSAALGALAGRSLRRTPRPRARRAGRTLARLLRPVLMHQLLGFFAGVPS